MERFQIGEYQVDVKRNQLTISDRTTFVEPKVMDVLRHLALKQGEVVSQQELFDALWPNSVFSSGSVLRCIAQLRKALGDDAKQQAMILTHPKRGYSLKLKVEIPVSLDEENKVQVTQLPIEDSHSTNKYIRVINKFNPVFFTLALIVVSAVLFINRFSSGYSTVVKSEFNKLTPVSSTKHVEYQPKFSPTENSIAFIRTDQFSQTHIWVKNLDTKQEYQLSNKANHFLSFSWSNEGRDIAYLSKTNLGYEIGYFSVPISTLQSSTAQVLSRFESESHAGAIQWGNKNDLYYLLFPKDDLVSTKAEVHSLNMKTQVSQLYWQPKGGFSPNDMSLSPDKKSLALSGYETNFMSSIKVLSVQDKTLVSIKNNLPTYTEVSWHPSGEYLLLTDAEEISLLSLDGDIKKVEWPNFYDIENPTFDTEGERIVLTLSKADVDILLQSTRENAETRTISNSNSVDSSARFSPNDSTVLYLSDQAGYQQVFQYHLGDKKLFFANSSKRVIESPPLWNADGKRVLINTSSQLIMIDAHTLDQTVMRKSVSFSYVYDWFQNEDALLVDYRSDAGLTVAKYDLNTQELMPIVSGNIVHAHLIQNNLLIVIKDDKIVGVKESEEVTIFEPLPYQQIVGSVSTVEGVLFQLNGDLEDEVQTKELWKMNALDNQITYVAKVPDHLDKIMDVSSDGNKRLFITPAQQDKDIVLLE